MLIRDVEVEGVAGLDVRIGDGRVMEIGHDLAASGEVVEGRGGALLPGLIDHHIHLLGLAAQGRSLRLDAARDVGDFERMMTAALTDRTPGEWLRATGYHEGVAGDIDRFALDHIAPAHPVRVQHRTGALWILNTAALDRLGPGELPPAVERGHDGRPTGRIWRGDDWLRDRLAEGPPPLAPIGRRLAALGITGLTDASVTTDAGAADILARAFRTGDLPQRLTLMSGGALMAPADGAFAVGPVKILPDDADLPDLDDIVATIRRARGWGRATAVHCVTAGELALTLAAFGMAGPRAGDRIEHGSVIAESAIAAIAELGLAVVTQSAFVAERGDRYLRDVDPAEHRDLYRCRSLLAAGIAMAGSSDAPYAAPDPWAGIRAAIGRTTRDGVVLGAEERVDGETALSLFLRPQHDLAAPARTVVAGAAADLCLLSVRRADMLAHPDADAVAATLIGGRIVHRR